MKARPFEIAASGAMAINGPFEELAECFQPGAELAVAQSHREWLDAIVYYLEREPEREKMAAAALQRCLAEHTYERRFNQLFDHIQLTQRP
jgi:spore maturation protein CgeB